MSIAIIDYGMGNLRSVQKAFLHLDADAFVTRDPQKIFDANKVVLPGVGAFRDCMHNLKEYGLIEPILKTIEKGKPFLGICLGMQLLMTESEEFGRHAGLGVIPGKVLRFPLLSTEQGKALKVPHMGWNQLEFQKASPLFKGLGDEPYVYFVHSYYVVPEDPKTVTSMTDYGLPFASSLSKDHVFAMQFHPEKSQAVGLKILKNFAKLD